MPANPQAPGQAKPKVHGKRMKPLTAQDASTKPKNKTDHDAKRDTYCQDWLAQVGQT